MKVTQHRKLRYFENIFWSVILVLASTAERWRTEGYRWISSLCCYRPGLGNPDKNYSEKPEHLHKAG